MMLAHLRMRAHRAGLLAALLLSAASLTSRVSAQPPAVDPFPRQAPLIDCPGPEVRNELFKPLSDVRSMLPADDQVMPLDCSQDLFAVTAQPRIADVQLCYFWQPPSVIYHPAYFDDVPLERYGQTVHPLLQPAISGARFFSTFAALPYAMVVRPIHEQVSDSGLFRPGSPAPCMRQRLPRP